MKKPNSHRLVAVIYTAHAQQPFQSRRPRLLHPLLGRPLGQFSIELARCLGADPIALAAPGPAAPYAVLEQPGLHLVAAPRPGLSAALIAARPLLRRADEVLLLPAELPLLPVERLRALSAAKHGSRAPLALLRAGCGCGCGGGGGDCGGAAKLVNDDDVDEASCPVLWCDGAIVERWLSQRPGRGADPVVDLTVLAERSGPVVAIVGDSTELLSIETRLDLAEATEVLGQAINAMHMLSGVTIEDPASTLIEPTVTLGRDVVIGANVQLRGRCQVADDVRIDASVVIVDSVIERDAHIKSFSHLEGATVRRGALIGPYARLRPAADIGAEAHIGNFVEVKKSVVEAGAKANHLAYLGDARIGARANVGAGTICCNYDGASKNPTDIGAGVFIGSNATLVAPIRIGDGAYVAAGSTLTKDVPAGALAFGRARQDNKQGLAVKLRARIKARASGAKKK